jgi:hypothetical protein
VLIAIQDVLFLRGFFVRTLNKREVKNMSIKNRYSNRFYLGFNKDTGELVDVVGPKDEKIDFHPENFKLLHNEDIDNTTRTELQSILSELRSEIRTSSLPAKRLVFIDNPNHSICGGSCGGIPFRFCRR